MNCGVRCMAGDAFLLHPFLFVCCVFYELSLRCYENKRKADMAYRSRAHRHPSHPLIILFGLELCVRQLRVCGSPLAVCLVSLFVSVCRSCVPSSPFYLPTYLEKEFSASRTKEFYPPM